ncbi:hypothetical protein H2O64_00065 [Kordia sp. YSTF-M3]|uniref:Uncharacterized protein n=1 Tax=Kordia aestuariivivens TaxID=2759037 RepID=A0ABR7Q3B7_9FLAO|nr:hypothetical protein [Kordia aestuariivivens]MBC8753044.1 hypothetical protein [Kordia aestuariivivens]
MDYLDEKNFVEGFGFSYCDYEFHEDQSYQACLRIQSTLNDLISEGFSRYNAILEICKQVNISFEILLKLNHVITITTFMNNKEWSKNTFNGNRYDASKILGSEIHELFYIRFKNIIYIENASK